MRAGFNAALEGARAAGDPCPLAAAFMAVYKEGEWPGMAHDYLAGRIAPRETAPAWVEVARRCEAAGKVGLSAQILNAVIAGSAALPAPLALRVADRARAVLYRMDWARVARFKAPGTYPRKVF